MNVSGESETFATKSSITLISTSGESVCLIREAMTEWKEFDDGRRVFEGHIYVD